MSNHGELSCRVISASSTCAASNGGTLLPRPFFFPCPEFLLRALALVAFLGTESGSAAIGGAVFLSAAADGAAAAVSFSWGGASVAVLAGAASGGAGFVEDAVEADGVCSPPCSADGAGTTTSGWTAGVWDDEGWSSALTFNARHKESRQNRAIRIGVFIGEG